MSEELIFTFIIILHLKIILQLHSQFPKSRSWVKMASLWTDLIGVIINPDGTDEELDDIIFELLVNEENQDEQEHE